MDKINKENLDFWNERLKEFSLSEILKLVLENSFDGKVVFSTSFGIEDQVLIHYLNPYSKQIEVFTLDTGRQFNETYEVFQKTQSKYPNLKINTYYPDEKDVQEYYQKSGVNGFYNSVEDRKSCCFIRKVKPLHRALSDVNLWITGLRAEQSPNREKMQFLEWDEQYNLIKFNPLLNYTLESLESEVEKNSIPLNSLYKKGFLSIGCQPCTRALLPGENFRDGRWWWENGKKECGLHIQSNINN